MLLIRIYIVFNVRAKTDVLLFKELTDESLNMIELRSNKCLKEFKAFLAAG